jgi:hypothetical protein
LPRHAAADDLHEILIRLRAAEDVAPEIDAGDLVAVGTVAVGARVLNARLPSDVLRRVVLRAETSATPPRRAPRQSRRGCAVEKPA